MSGSEPTAPDTPAAGLRSRLATFLGAWQPFTGPGLARFAEASLPRLIAFQMVFAGALGLLFAWSFGRIATPVVQSALPVLPTADAGIRSGRLQWPEPEPRLLAATPQLALGCDPGNSGDLGLNGDLQAELRPEALVLRGLLGSLALGYPPGLEIPLDRTAAPAVWGAWRLPLRAAVATAAALWLPLTWWLLALGYWLPAWCCGWLCARNLPPAGALRLSAAALLPASVIPGVALMAYTTLWIRAPGLVFLWALHLPAGWLWILWGILSRPAQSRNAAASAPGSSGPNPFSGDRLRPRDNGPKRGRKNPFGG